MISKIKKRMLYKKYDLDINKVNIELPTVCTVKSLDIKGYFYMNIFSFITGSGTVHVDDNVIIGPNVKMFTSVHDYNTDELPYNGNKNITDDIFIGKNVWIGSDVLIMPGVHIGEGSVIGAKSFINKDIPPLSIAVGSPAKVIKKRDKEKYMKLKAQNKLYLPRKYKS